MAQLIRELEPLSRTDIVRYAGAGGDFNPIHHDDEHARKAGFPSVFAMGMYTAGLAGVFGAESFGPQNVREFSCRFVAQVWPDERLCITFDDPSKDGRRQFAVTNDGTDRVVGELVIDGDLSGTLSDFAQPVALDLEGDELTSIAATSLDTVTLPVERGKILEFARALHADAESVFTSVERARSQGFEDLPAPPTFTQAVAHWNGGDASDVPIALGFDLARVLHGSQSYVFARPVTAGDVLTGHRSVSDVRRKTNRSGATMTFATVRTDFVDEAGHPVVREEQTMIEMPRKSAD